MVQWKSEIVAVLKINHFLAYYFDNFLNCYRCKIKILLLVIYRKYNMNIQEKLKKHAKKTITSDELKKLYKANESSDLYPIVQELLKNGNLVPIKNSGTNGNKNYPLHMKYRIVTDYQNEIEEISVLHPKLQEKEYLKNHPDKYIKYREAFQLLNTYLFQDNNLTVSISKKERSFEIFHEEKMLENSELLNILFKIGLNYKSLAFYETPEYCFHDYIRCKKDAMNILILENKDIWFNLRRIMFENNFSVLFKTKLDGVLYGEGKKIAGSDALNQYGAFLNCNDIQFFYWGDIDREGLNIYCSLLKNSESCKVALFVPAYEKMLELSTQQQIPYSNDRRNITADYSNIFPLFPLEYRTVLEKSLADNKRIPQEIINYKWLRENME